MARPQDEFENPDDWYCDHDGCRADGSGETWAAIEEHLLHHREADALALLPEVLEHLTCANVACEQICCFDLIPRIRALIGGERE